MDSNTLQEKLESIPGEKPFSFSEQYVFGKFEAFCCRLTNILGLFDDIDKFSAFFEGRAECEIYIYVAYMCRVLDKLCVSAETFARIRTRGQKEERTMYTKIDKILEIRYFIIITTIILPFPLLF